jgi:site-specific recombinase XerD
MQHNEVLLPPVARYTRTDFTALRAWLQGIPAQAVFERYFDEDEGRFSSAADLERFLSRMREDLIARLIERNPKTAESLQHARHSHLWSRLALDYLVAAADAKTSAPVPDDPVSAWFKPVAARRLAGDGLRTLAALLEAIRQRGKGWYRPIPRLGVGKARVIEDWLRSHAASLGALPAVLDAADEAGLLVLKRTLALAAHELDGTAGRNRHAQSPLISAQNDYDALQAYLYKFRGRDKTHDSYRKELERFLLWCLTERGRAMSDLMVDDCEAFKDFLAALPPRWIGPRRPRSSSAWRPFSAPLSAKSQRYALQCCQSFFAWLVDVRYLAANPFAAVSAPLVAQAIHPMQIEKALSAPLWEKLAAPGGILDALCALPDDALMRRYKLRCFGAHSVNPASSELFRPQLRLLRAVILVLGATGMRREELVGALRNRLSQPYQDALWRLAVLGKRKKWRYVYLTDREAEALAVHWTDRGDDFYRQPLSAAPLVSPVLMPMTAAARARHDEEDAAKGFTTSGLNKLLSAWRARLAQDEALDLTPDERTQIRRMGLHALRHTMATHALESGMPLAVVQQGLGHASLNTTSLYVQSAEQQAADAFRKWRKCRVT